MTIKEKLEKAKANAKRRVRKAAIGAALVGTLGAGAVSCGEANIKKDNNKNKAEISAQITSYDDNAYLFEEENHGVPIMKHAKNKNEPDSVLTKVEVDDNGKVTSKKYAAVKHSDKDTEATLRTNVNSKDGDLTITEKWERKVPLHKAELTDDGKVYEENFDLYESKTHGVPIMKHAKNTNEPDSVLTKLEVDDNGNVISKKYAAVKRSDKDTEAKLRTNISRKAGDFTITEKWGRKVPLHKAKAMDYDEIYEENAELYEREIHGNKVMKHAEKDNEPDSLLTNIEIDKDGKVINNKYTAVEPDEEEQIATTDITKHGKIHNNISISSKYIEGFVMRKAKTKEK